MARKKAADTNEADSDATSAGKAGKAGKVKAIGLAVAFAALGAVLGPKLLGGGGSAPAGAAEDTTTTTEAGPVVVLDPITLNLADGHLLKVGLALELSAEGGGEGEGEGEGPADDDPTKGYAKALDAAIDVLGDQTMGSLGAAGGRDAAKEGLEAALHELYHGEVVGVYFHEFVMQ